MIEKYYRRGGPGDKIYQDILQRMEARLCQAGPIQTADAWDICQKGAYSYSIVSMAFKGIMEEKLAAGEATRVRAGRYIISKEKTVPERSRPAPLVYGKPTPPAKKVLPFYSRVYKQMIYPS